MKAAKCWCGAATLQLLVPNPQHPRSGTCCLEMLVTGSGWQVARSGKSLTRGLRLSRSSAVLHREVCAQRPRCREIVEGGPDTAGDDDSEQGIADGFSPIEGGQQIA